MSATEQAGAAPSLRLSEEREVRAKCHEEESSAESGGSSAVPGEDPAKQAAVVSAFIKRTPHRPAATASHQEQHGEDDEEEDVSSVSSSEVSVWSSDEEGVEVDDWGETVGQASSVAGFGPMQASEDQMKTSINSDEMHEIMRSLGVKLTDDEIQGDRFPSSACLMHAEERPWGSRAGCVNLWQAFWALGPTIRRSRRITTTLTEAESVSLRLRSRRHPLSFDLSRNPCVLPCPCLCTAMPLMEAHTESHTGTCRT